MIGTMRPRDWLLPLMLASQLSLAASVTGGGASLPLAKPSPGDDPRWLRQLPDPVLPLPKLRASPDLSRAEVGTPAAQAAAGIPVEGTSPRSSSAAAEPPIRPTRATEPSLDERPVPIAEQADAVASAPPLVENPPLIGATGLGSEMAPDTERPGSVTPPPETRAPSMSGAAPPEKARPPRYRWHVQLLAGRALDKVEEDGRVFVNRYSDLLEGLTLAISRSSYGDARDEFYRLRAKEWTTREEAAQWCARLQVRGGHACLVTRISLPSDPDR